jgi:hypothetical protein
MTTRRTASPGAAENTSGVDRSVDGGLRRIFRDNLPSIHWAPLETGAVCPGLPDSNGCCRGREFMVEFKATRGVAVKFRPLQPGWIVDRTQHGGRVFVFVRQRLETGEDLLWGFGGRDVVRLVSTGLRGAEQFALDVWRGGPRRWDWAQIEETLLR